MTDFELSVWAAAYAAGYERAVHEMAKNPASEAFEMATLAILELRNIKVEPVFGAESGETGVIEQYVLGQLRGKP
jgi:hypothetical protein